MSTVHQKFQADLDTKAYEAGLHRMENATKTSTARSAREFSKIDQSMSRQAANMGGSKGSMRAGQIAMQMQDIGVQMQQGARASTIIAQQGSQILSVFGPQGMLLGGLVAAGAMFWELVRGAKALNKESQEQKSIARQNRQTAAAQAGLQQLKNDEMATKIAKARVSLREEEVKQLERRLEFEQKIKSIEENPNLTPENKAVFKEAAQNRFNAEESAINKLAQRERGTIRVREEGQTIIDRAEQIRGEAPSKAEARRREREVARSERRAISEEMDAEDRKRRNRQTSKESQMEDPARSGLSDKEKEQMRGAREKAVEEAKKKDSVILDQDSIDKILKGIDGLIER